MTPTLRALTSKYYSRGFSLVEILVSLFLVALIFLLVPTGDQTALHRAIQESVDHMDRTVRFAANESVLRNRLVRIKIDLDKDPVDYTVEYGTSENLILPGMSEKKNLSLAEEKIELEKSAKLDQQFSKIDEFEEIKKTLSQDVVILGIATSFQEKIIDIGNVYIYFYPTGERDAAVIFFSTTQEFAYLMMEPFQLKTIAEYIPYDQNSVASLEDTSKSKMNEIYQQWQKQ